MQSGVCHNKSICFVKARTLSKSELHNNDTLNNNSNPQARAL